MSDTEKRIDAVNTDTEKHTKEAFDAEADILKKRKEQLSKLSADEMFEQLINSMKESADSEEIEMLQRAYSLADEAHKGQFRLSGEPYIVHPVNVAVILHDLGMDSESMAAALLHDVVEDTSLTIEEVKKDFGEDVAVLVEGVTKLGKVPLSTKEEQQAENIRKMLMAMSQDIRVIIIKANKSVVIFQEKRLKFMLRLHIV